MAKVFICHASEDKAYFVKPLADRLINSGVEVWYDEYSLVAGDSLTEKIDEGLSNCEKGVVVFSPTFFKKGWTRKELNALFQRHVDEGNVIIPLWHNVGKKEVSKYSTLSADIVAIKTIEGVNHVVYKLLDILLPNTSKTATDEPPIKVSPNKIVLCRNGWPQKTPIMVYNTGQTPFYQVMIKIRIVTKGIDADSVEIETLGEEPSGMRVGEWGLNPSTVIFVCVDKEGKESIFISLFSLPPSNNKQLLVSGTTPRDSEADVTIVQFKTEPSSIIEKGEKGGVYFTFPESVVLKSCQMQLDKEPKSKILQVGDLSKGNPFD